MEWVAIPSPEDLSDPEIKPRSPVCRQVLHCLSHQGSAKSKKKMDLNPSYSLFFLLLSLSLIFAYLAVLGLSVTGDLRSSLWPVGLFN